MGASLPLGAVQGWRAQLQLGFERRGERTRLMRRSHRGPLMVQRTFHPEGAPCHTYLLHPPGGVVGGDRLALEVEVGPEAHALITTPAAGKFYRSAGDWAHQTQCLRLREGARLEWLPQENILHGGSRTRLETRFELAADSALMAWDLLCLGRPASADPFDRGECRQRLAIVRGARPLLEEQLRLEAGDPLLTAPWGLGGAQVLATLVALPVDAEAAQAARALVEQGGPVRAAVTLIEDALILRALGPDSETVRTLLDRIWALLRPAALGLAPARPRIWNT